MDTFYPPGPKSVPTNLTKASAAYKHRAWIAMAVLGLFLGLYIGLTYWFAFISWRMFSSFGQRSGIEWTGAFACIAAAFMFVFMAKALFAVKHSGETRDTELTKEEHPVLFEFLYKLADEASAPRPHKVYASAHVNAAVFYDLSLLNLIFPSKKNLLIGLGLVNVLSIGELKAVLAHEFGHFAQRSMAVGRWVYIAQQIAGHIIAGRDALDRFLQRLSRVDLRIAWIGWILSLVVWSIRSLLDSVFSLVVLSERALSRQMEFQADLVAVSLTGSDALIHALNKLHAGDDAWRRTLNFATQEAREGRRVPDLFAVQTQILLKLKKIYGDETYGEAPAIPESSPEKHRVFTSNIASPPQMWSTHPENQAREDNAKRNYIYCEIDLRNAWQIFNTPKQVRLDISKYLLAGVNKELTAVTIEESLGYLNKTYGKPWLLPCYRGTYLGRSVVRHAEQVSDLYENDFPEPSIQDLDQLYPETLTDQLENLRELYEEKHMLEALRDKVLKAAGGLIQFRGETIKRRDLPKVIASVETELQELETHLTQHDKQVRTIHLAAATKLGSGWREYLEGLISVMHFADHSDTEIRDVNGYVVNVWKVITADGRISKAETGRLIQAVNEAHASMEVVFNTVKNLKLNSQIKKKLGDKELAELIGDYNLPAPTRENINEWMKVFDGWIGAFSYSLAELKFATLELLLLGEAKIAGALRQGSAIEGAPEAPAVNGNYKTLVPGKGRKLQKKLDLWDSFFTATGYFPAMARFLVAASIVGAVFWWGQSLGETNITVYNGLSRDVFVDINGLKKHVSRASYSTLKMLPSENYSVTTTTKNGEIIDSFTKESSNSGFQHLVYNVAAASPLSRQRLAGGNSSYPKNYYLGAQKWLTTHADYYFHVPTSTRHRLRSQGGLSLVLKGFGDYPPDQQISMLTNADEINQLVQAHTRWDEVNSEFIIPWLTYLKLQENANAILQIRLAENPNSIALLRFEQDLNSDESSHEKVCTKHSRLAENNPDNSGYHYLKIRCMKNKADQANAYKDAQKKWPNSPWLALTIANQHALNAEWNEALDYYSIATENFSPLKARIAESIVRIQRGSRHRRFNISEFVRLSGLVSYKLALEKGDGFAKTPLFAYSHLQNGKLSKALDVAKGDQIVYPNILSLVASSSGAKSEWINAALDLPIESISGDAIVWSLFALAQREGRDAASYQEHLQAYDRENADTLFSFFEALSKTKKVETAAKHLKGISPQAHGYAHMIAAVYLQERCPKEWRNRAISLLFVDERPFFNR